MEFPRRTNSAPHLVTRLAIACASTPATRDTCIALPPNETQPIGFVVCTDAHPGQAAKDLIERARSRCEEGNVRIAIVHVGCEPDAPSKINEALNDRVNAHTVVCMVSEPSSPGGPLSLDRSRAFDAARNGLSNMAQALPGPADETPGTLAHPATCCVDDVAAQSRLDQCIALCGTKKEALDKAHKWLPYRREVDAWSRGQGNGEFVKAKIEKMLQGIREGLFSCMVADDQDALMLDLGCLALAELPPLPDSLTHLSAYGNRLTHVADLPSSLIELNLSYNHLSGTLDLKGASGLEWLYLTHNQITGLDLDWCSLHRLMIVDNKLTSLVLDDVPCLQVVDASNNPIESLVLAVHHVLDDLSLGDTRLTGLPESIMTVGTNVEVRGAPLSLSVLAALRARVGAPGYQGPNIRFDMAASSSALPDVSLAEAVAAWCTSPDGATVLTIEEERPPLVEIWDTLSTKKGATDFSRFLVRLLHTPVGVRESSRNAVVGWLGTIASDAALCELTFLVAEDATASCDDRVSLTFNKMQLLRTCHDVTVGKYDQDLPTLVHLARGMFRLAALEQVAMAKAGTLKLIDEIEVHLAYIEHLHEALDMPGEKPDACFTNPVISGVTTADLAHAAQAVKQRENTDFPAFLADWAPWRAVLGRCMPTELGEVEDELVSPETYEVMGAEIDKELDALQLVGKARDDAKTLALRDRGAELKTRLMHELTALLLAKYSAADLLEPCWP